MLKGKTVVLGVTGSIAAYKIANLARLAILYAAILPVTPRTTVFPLSILSPPAYSATF